MKRNLFFSLAVFFILGVLAELILRGFFGFCDAPLSQTSDNYEYLFQPNQNRFRFGRHIRYNEFGMRSDRIDKKSIKVLGLGDSVINGGSFTDQDSIATSILSTSLSNTLQKPVQLLNISAGSWGPDNCNAYLDEYGSFDAELMVLVVSSHDSHDMMDFKPIVGISSAFPDKQYALAIWELFDRYIYPKYISKIFESSGEDFNEREGIKKDGKGFNQGFVGLAEKAKQWDIPMIIYLHADKSELKNGAYNEQGIEIMQFAKANSIKLIKDLDHGLDKSWFHDDIHLNNKGQRMMAKVLSPYISNFIKY
jgi:hypothetical protein